MNDLTLDRLYPDLIKAIMELRHDLHRIPEMALEEHLTRNRLMKELEDLPLSFHKPYLGTDIVADLIPPQGEDGIIILRADMDGLRITEEGEREWKSEHPGRMHACGHDGHMAILTGAAKLLSRRLSSLKKTVRFVFQPGEEMLCSGRLLAEAGAYDGGSVAYGLHGWPGINEGVIRTRGGVFMAATDTFSFTFTGKGAHGATPEEGNNPLFPVSQFILQAKELHQRRNAREGSVISPCIVRGGTSSNIIPDECIVQGTTRYLESEQGKSIQDELTRLAQEEAMKAGVSVQSAYERLYYLPVINDKREADRVLRLAARLFGDEAAMESPRHDMMAEDFAFCLDKVGGCFFHLGLGKESPGLHTSRFDFNDRVLERGILLFTALAGGWNE